MTTGVENEEMTKRQERLEALLEFPLLQALFGRRARRFGLGMEIPSRNAVAR